MNLLITLHDGEKLVAQRVEFFDVFVIGFDDHDDELGKVQIVDIVKMEAV